MCILRRSARLAAKRDAAAAVVLDKSSSDFETSSSSDKGIDEGCDEVHPVVPPKGVVSYGEELGGSYEQEWNDSCEHQLPCGGRDNGFPSQLSDAVAELGSFTHHSCERCECMIM